MLKRERQESQETDPLMALEGVAQAAEEAAGSRTAVAVC